MKTKNEWVYLGRYNSELEAIRSIREWEVEERLRKELKGISEPKKKGNYENKKLGKELEKFS